MFAHPGCAGMGALPAETQSVTAEVVLHKHFCVSRHLTDSLRQTPPGEKPAQSSVSAETVMLIRCSCGICMF